MRAKILAILLVLVFFAVFAFLYVPKVIKDKEKVEVKDDFLTIPTYTTEPVTTTSSYGDSYWFVLVEEKDGTMKMNSFIKQNHKYFSVSEAKAEFKKDVFIINFIEVSKETYDKNQ